MSTTMATGRERYWVPGDWNAFFGFGTNILVNVLVLTGLLRFVLKMPDSLVFGRNSSRSWADVVPQHGLLRMASVSPGPEDGPNGCLRSSVRHQCATYVRGHFRGHAANPAPDERSDPGMGGWPHLGLCPELRFDGGRLHRAGDPQDHAARGAARFARRHFDHLHLDAARPPRVRDAAHRHGVLRNHLGQLVRRRTLFPGRAGRPDCDRRWYSHRLGIEHFRSRLWRLERRECRRRLLPLRVLVSHSGRRPCLFRFQVHRNHIGHGDSVRHL